MDEANLLPCPFCGRAPSLQEHAGHRHSAALKALMPGLPDAIASWSIECCDVGMIKGTRADAVTAWNRRATPPITPARDDAADPGQWIVLGGQRIGKSYLADVQQDAARYRWLRDKADGMACTAAPMVASLDAAGRIVGLIDGEELDAAVDMAAARRATKTKRAANAQ